MSAIRFAALIRVSTEKQERKGESLRTQRNQIERSVHQIDGAIVEWYGGQEHGTSGYEKVEVNRLLKDASRKKFDAVIVSHPDRWSRDNIASETGLEQLREHGIKFYVLTQEYNLFDPSARLFLSLSTTIGSYQARLQKLKSVQSCIERAKRTGAPTAGKPPYGRIWNRDTETWSIDEQKQSQIEDCARRYVAGESSTLLAKEIGLNHAFLMKTLRDSCGDTYTISWDIDDLNIHESVTITIPRLLPEKLIKQVQRKAQNNRTYNHNAASNNEYLLQGYVYCAACGTNLTGQVGRIRNYYRHRRNGCTLRPRPYVRCDDLENAVLSHLFELFGNPAGVERAIEKFSPNKSKIQEYTKRRKQLQTELDKLASGRDRVLDLIIKGNLSDTQAEKKLSELNSRERELIDSIERLDSTVEHLPDAATVRAVAEDVHDAFRKLAPAKRTAAIGKANRSFDAMTFSDKRALLARVFDDAKTPDGKPAGVHVSPIDGQQDFRHKQFRFALFGHWRIDGMKCVTACASDSPAPAPPARRSV